MYQKEARLELLFACPQRTRDLQQLPRYHNTQPDLTKGKRFVAWTAVVRLNNLECTFVNHDIPSPPKRPKAMPRLPAKHEQKPSKQKVEPFNLMSGYLRFFIVVDVVVSSKTFLYKSKEPGETVSATLPPLPLPLPPPTTAAFSFYHSASLSFRQWGADSQASRTKLCLRPFLRYVVKERGRPE